MAPTIPAGSTVQVGLTAYGRMGPERYDIVLFVPPGRRDRAFVFRDIGLPGERVELDAKGVSANGRRLSPPHGLVYVALEHYADEMISAVRLGPTEYFLLGDNTHNARDSRVFGPIPRDDIVGKVTAIVPPTGHRDQPRWSE